MRWLAVVAMAVAAPPQTDTRVVVAIGANVGIGADEPLDYAEEDARRFHRLMIEIGGVTQDRAYIVAGENASGVRRVLHEARGRLRELANDTRTSLIVFVSSHADQDALHLSGTRLAIAELHALVRTSAADVKLTVIDACQTAAIVKAKGGRPVPEVDVAFEAPSRVDGDVFIASASPGEPAQERAFLRGALFSHHLLTGLRGAADIDGDRAVSLSEAYGYAYRRTAAAAVLGGAPQHPSFSFDVQGVGSWVLTRPGSHHAALVLGQDIEGTVWVANRKQELVAEVAKINGEVVRLALPAGWYRVVQPSAVTARVADVNLGWGGEQRVEGEDFVRVRRAKSILRGRTPIQSRPWRLALGYGVGANPLPGSGVEQLALLRVSRRFGAWLGRAQLTGTTSAVETANGHLRNWAFGLGVAGAYTVPVAWFDVGIGAEISVTGVRQDFQRDDEATVERLFGVTDSDRTGLVIGAAALSYLAVPIDERFWVQLEVAFGAARVPLDGASEVEPIVRAGLLVSYSL